MKPDRFRYCLRCPERLDCDDLEQLTVPQTQMMMQRVTEAWKQQQGKKKRITFTAGFLWGFFLGANAGVAMGFLAMVIWWNLTR